MFSLAPNAVVLATIRLKPLLQVVIVGGAEECLQIGDRLRGEQLFDDARDSRCVRGERAYHPVLRVAECRLRLDRHRRVVELPAVQPGRLVQLGRPAQQRDVGQTRCARTGLDAGASAGPTRSPGTRRAARIPRRAGAAPPPSDRHSTAGSTCSPPRPPAGRASSASSASGAPPSSRTLTDSPGTPSRRWHRRPVPAAGRTSRHRGRPPQHGDYLLHEAKLDTFMLAAATGPGVPSVRCRPARR